jgi:hypothetical protein
MRLPKPTREDPTNGGRKLSQLRLQCLCIVVTLGALAQPSPAAPIDVGQIDDFQDGTTQGWGSGAANPNPPINAADAGPEGIGDHSLLITSSGEIGFPGSNFVAFNMSQWAGDYLTPEVDPIVMDVNNVGIADLDLRLAFNGPGGWFASAVAVPLNVDSGWQEVGFPIGTADLTSDFVEGGFDVDATLADVTELRLLSAASPNFRGDTIAAQLLVDNIAVPEPSRPVLLAAGLSALLLLARRRVKAKRI